MPGSLPILPPPKPKFELFVAVLTLAITIYTTFRVIKLQESVNNLKRSSVPDEGRNFEPDVNSKL